MKPQPVFNEGQTKFYLIHGAIFGVPCYEIIEVINKRAKGHFVCSVRDIETAERWLVDKALPEECVTIDWSSGDQVDRLQ